MTPLLQFDGASVDRSGTHKRGPRLQEARVGDRVEDLLVPAIRAPRIPGRINSAALGEAVQGRLRGTAEKFVGGRLNAGMAHDSEKGRQLVCTLGDGFLGKHF